MGKLERFNPPKGSEVVSVEAASRNHGFRIPFTSFYIIRGEGYLWSRMMIAADREKRVKKEIQRQEAVELDWRQAQKHAEMGIVPTRIRVRK